MDSYNVPHETLASIDQQFASTQDPYALYDRLRADDPVFSIKALRGCVITRYDDVADVAPDHERFSNIGRIQMFTDSLPGHGPRAHRTANQPFFPGDSARSPLPTPISAPPCSKSSPRLACRACSCEFKSCPSNLLIGPAAAGECRSSAISPIRW